MNKAETIKKQLELLGREVRLIDGEWTSMPFKAYISHLWRKKTSNFEAKYTPLGKSFDEYYLYVGPYNHNITLLSEEAVVSAGNDKYELKCADAVLFGDDIIYYTCILKRLREE